MGMSSKNDSILYKYTSTGWIILFTGVVAKQVAREGFSNEMWVCLNLNEV